nr:hypothetical protein GCM10025732_20990 [Glycomyces mayteni]
MAHETAKYIHGHHESVLRSHAWRTAENSAAYLLPYLKTDHVILDIGCGPGTITADFAEIAHDGRVTGVDYVADVLAKAEAAAAERGLTNAVFEQADVHGLRFADDTFDVVHAHQVLQHVSDPVQALREMRRVAKPGGLIAVRDSDYAAFTWFPGSEGSPRGSTCTRRSPARAAASPTRAGASSPGPSRPGSPRRRSRRPPPPGPSPTSRTGPGGAASGPTAASTPTSPSRPSTAATRTPKTSRRSPRRGRPGAPPRSRG